MSLQTVSFLPKTGTATHLLVVLHGWGANAQDLASIAGELKLPEFRFEFPEAPLTHPYTRGGKMWYDLETREFRGLGESRQQLLEWLLSLERDTGLPLSRTILAGFSQGGAMTLDVGLRLPLAGLVCLSGYLQATPDKSPERVLPPILIVHGRQDPVVPLSAAIQARDSLTSLGAKVQYQEFDMGHYVIPEVIDLVRSFVVETVLKAG